MRTKYPYLVIRVMATVYNTRDLPDGLPRDELIAQVRTMMEKHERFRMCIVFGPKEAVFLELDGAQAESDDPPSGGLDIPVAVVEPQTKRSFPN